MLFKKASQKQTVCDSNIVKPHKAHTDTVCDSHMGKPHKADTKTVWVSYGETSHGPQWHCVWVLHGETSQCRHWHCVWFEHCENLIRPTLTLCVIWTLSKPHKADTDTVCDLNIVKPHRHCDTGRHWHCVWVSLGETSQGRHWHCVWVSIWALKLGSVYAHFKKC